MIGHALVFAPRLAGRMVWGRWIAIGFAVGSACFLIGPFPGFVQLVGAGADGAVFFAGSIDFTLEALLEVRESTLRLGRWAADPSWWSAAAAKWTTGLGALCFLIGAALLLPRRHVDVHHPQSRPLVPMEV